MKDLEPLQDGGILLAGDGNLDSALEHVGDLLDCWRASGTWHLSGNAGRASDLHAVLAGLVPLAVLGGYL